MGTGMKLLNTFMRDMERSAKAAEREQARRIKEQERRARELERERIKQQKEDILLKLKLSKEQIKAEKERIRKAIEKENAFFKKRTDARRKLRLEFINKVHT